MTEKKPVGRPRKFKSVEEMQEKIDAYFYEKENRMVDFLLKTGDMIQVKKPAPIHITGLCDYLEICNNTLNEYQALEEFSSSITRAKKRCEAYAVDQCFEGEKGNKADFVLKNNFRESWREERNVNLNDETPIDKRIVEAREKKKKFIVQEIDE